MSHEPEEKSSLSGLAKRWLKNQLSVHGDPRRAYRERRESEAIEQEIQDRVGQQAQETVAKGLFNTFAPAGLKQKVSQLQQMSAEHEANEAARRRAEHEAKPRAATELTLSGDLNGKLVAQLPAAIDRPEDAGDAWYVELVPLDSESIAGRPFRMFSFAIPGYAGPGVYDLEQLGQGNGADDWEPLWFQLVLDSEDEPFAWYPGAGPATIEVAPGEHAIQARFAMINPGSEQIEVMANISLPA